MISLAISCPEIVLHLVVRQGKLVKLYIKKLMKECKNDYCGGDYLSTKWPVNA